MIQPNDNSDNSWLVIADWMEENGVVGSGELRESIYNPISSIWEYQYRSSIGVVGSGIGSNVGGVGGGVGGVGGSVGGVGSSVGGVGSSVGGVGGGVGGIGSGIGSGSNL